MAEAPRNGHPDANVPGGLLEGLASPCVPGIREDEVVRARIHAAARVFDDVAVIEEIASQLLALSAS
jgi:hypothetical protein